MKSNKRIAVTGAFSYSGKYIARRLLDAGCEVITLTGRPEHLNPFDSPVAAYPFNFHQPQALIDTLQGVDTLVNTYWVRFDHGKASYFSAISNSRRLFQAAKKAGVQRVVHISVTKPDPYTNLPYFWGKAILEEDLIASGLSYSILRPTVIFGVEDILINNIAWFLRHFPLFPLPGDGNYRLQPIYVDDLAQLAVEQVFGSQNTIIDVIGPDTYTFRGLVSVIRSQVGNRALIVRTPPMLAQKLSSLAGWFLKDVVLTREEVIGLMDELLFVDAQPTGSTRFSDWVRQHADSLGKHYAHEIKRHYSAVKGAI